MPIQTFSPSLTQIVVCSFGTVSIGCQPSPSFSPWIDRRRGSSCTIIVSGASAWMTCYLHRLPVLLRKEDIQAWLDGTMSREELRPAAENALR